MLLCVDNKTLSPRQMRILRGYRAIAKAYPLVRSGDAAQSLRAQRGLEALLADTDAEIDGRTMNMVFLASQILLQNRRCETSRMMRTVTHVAELTDKFSKRLDDENATAYFRRYAMIAHSAAEYLRNVDESAAVRLDQPIAVLERAHLVPNRAAPILPASEARLHTLAVGVSVYMNHSETDPLNLRSAHDDALALHAAYRRLCREDLQGNKTPSGVYLPSKLSRVLVNQQATRREIWRFIDELRRLPSADREMDFVIISLSGHGVLDENGALFFLPYDYVSGSLLSTAVEIEELKNRLRMLGTHVLLIIDTCHSGAAARSPDGHLVRYKATKEDVRAALRKMAESERSLAILVAGRARERAVESTAFAGHGALTAAVTEFLNQKTFDEIVTKGNGPAVDVARQSGSGPLTLRDLRRYIMDRVDQFLYVQQTPDLFVSGPTAGNYRFEDIPLRFAESDETDSPE
jgi:hypothetical protein